MKATQTNCVTVRPLTVQYNNKCRTGDPRKDRVSKAVASTNCYFHIETEFHIRVKLQSEVFMERN